MRRLALSLVFLFVLAACVTRPEPIRERASASSSPFTSALATLHDFELDGVLYARPEDVTDPKVLVVAQLTYAVGQLNGERAVGRYERLVVSGITVAPQAEDTVEIRYHAKLPVAWANGEPPSRYTFVLPARAAPSDQVAFEEKYGESCIDPLVGLADPGSMFLLYRPHRDGCSLERSDVVTFEATTLPSSDETTGRYPEYDRVWDDDALEVVAIVSRDIESAGKEDEGVQTYAELVRRAQAYLTAWQPVAALRSDLDPAVPLDVTTPQVTLSASAADGRRIEIDVMLVPHDLESGSATFDPWFDSFTPTADLVLYNGHAGLGTNIRTLSQKGSFRPGKYVVWAVNGCDTFAYLDRTLADRRAVLNPDDRTGTKYMDIVSNVMPGHFKTAPAFAMTMLDAFVTASDPSKGPPKTYPQLLEAVDGEQVAVVTGEEDNAFDPTKHAVRAATGDSDAGVIAPAPTTVPPGGPTPPPGPKERESGCAIAAPADGDRPPWSQLVVVVVALAWLRARGRTRSARNSPPAARRAGPSASRSG